MKRDQPHVYVIEMKGTRRTSPWLPCNEAGTNYSVIRRIREDFERANPNDSFRVVRYYRRLRVSK